jgi:sec-independent protein translocase protein TatB
MFNVGGGELLVIMLVALIVLGPQRLPDAARQIGRVMGDLRRISSGFQQDLKDAFDDDDRPLPARRNESVPLASTVAQVDRRPSAHRDGDQEAAPTADDERATRTAPSPTGERSVAPAVASALDEIVTPVEPSSPAVVDTATESSSGPAPDGEALGDHRAAS